MSLRVMPSEQNGAPATDRPHRPDARDAAQPAAADQVMEDRLGLIVGMMGGKHDPRRSARRDAFEKSIADAPRALLQRRLSRLDRRPLGRQADAARPAFGGDEALVRVRLGAAQSMIQVGGVQAPAEFVAPVSLVQRRQQSDRVRTARDGDDERLARARGTRVVQGCAYSSLERYRSHGITEPS
jgi:hypothetical protein